MHPGHIVSERSARTAGSPPSRRRTAPALARRRLGCDRRGAGRRFRRHPRMDQRQSVDRLRGRRAKAHRYRPGPVSQCHQFPNGTFGERHFPLTGPGPTYGSSCAERHLRNFNVPPGTCGIGHERRRSSQSRKRRTRGASPAKNAFFSANSLFQLFRAVSAAASPARRVISSNLDARTSAGLTIQVPPHARTLGNAR